MNREFLRRLGIENLTDAHLDAIMAEHGKGIEREKNKLTEAVKEAENKDKQLAELQAQLAALHDDASEVDGIKSELEKLRKKIADDQAKAEVEEKTAKLRAELDKLVPEGMQFMNDYARNGVYSETLALFEKDPTKGLKGHFESLTKDEKGNYVDGVYANPNAPDKQPPMGNVDASKVDDDKLRAAMGLPAADGVK